MKKVWEWSLSSKWRGDHSLTEGVLINRRLNQEELG